MPWFLCSTRARPQPHPLPIEEKVGSESIDDASKHSVETVDEESEDIPDDLLCPICYHLYDEPVSWPTPACADHVFCRRCIEQYCRRMKSADVCPICRSHATTEKRVLNEIWKLPINDVTEARIRADFSEQHAQHQQRRAERWQTRGLYVPLFADFTRCLVSTTRPGSSGELYCGKTVEIVINSPVQFLTLATALSQPLNSPSSGRFGLLLDDQAWGFIAGLISPKLPRGKSIRATLSQMCLRGGKWSFKCLVIKCLLVDTFTLECPPQKAEVDPTIANIIQSNVETSSESGAQHETEAPLMAHCITGGTRLVATDWAMRSTRLQEL